VHDINLILFYILQLDSKIITIIVTGNVTGDESLLKNNSMLNWNHFEIIGWFDLIFNYILGRALINSMGLGDDASGISLLIISLTTLSLCLIFIVKILHSMLK